MTSVYKALGFLLLRSYSSDGGLLGHLWLVSYTAHKCFTGLSLTFKTGLFELVTLQPAQEQIAVNSFLKVSAEEKKKSVGRKKSVTKRKLWMWLKFYYEKNSCCVFTNIKLSTNFLLKFYDVISYTLIISIVTQTSQRKCTTGKKSQLTWINTKLLLQFLDVKT